MINRQPAKDERLYQQIVTTVSSKLSVDVQIIATPSQQLSELHFVEFVR
jgi:hypothetical protein